MSEKNNSGLSNQDVVNEIKAHEEISANNRATVIRWAIGIVITIVGTGIGVSSKVSRDFGQLEKSVQSNTEAIVDQDNALKELKNEVQVKQRENKADVLREPNQIHEEQCAINNKLDQIIREL